MLPNSHAVRAILTAAILGLSGFVASTAHADDCALVKAAMLRVVRTPHTVTIGRMKDGQPVTNRMIQTKDAKYVEIKGKWRILPLSQDDFREMEKSLNESTLTCARAGGDSVDGKSATIYTVHIKNEDTESDAKLWLGTDGLPLKTESKHDGEAVQATYDFAHADAPPDATPLGPR
jgi:hypothetical protein